MYNSAPKMLWDDNGSLLDGIYVLKKIVNGRCSHSLDIENALRQARAKNLPNFSVKSMFKSNTKLKSYKNNFNKEVYVRRALH